MVPFVRSIKFVLPGSGKSPGIEITAIESENGTLTFTADVLNDSMKTADLRGLFFQIADQSKLAGMTFTQVSGDPITGFQAKADAVIDLGHGNNMNGAVKSGFDVGLAFGHEGIGKGKFDVTGPVTFKLGNTAGNLTLDDIAQTQFGARLTSVGAPSGTRNDSVKLLHTAPAAPDARGENYTILEDNASNLADPRSTASSVVFNVLANDTDADGNTLTITNLWTSTLGKSVTTAMGGTVTIVDGDDADLLANDAILYTPKTDYSGPDSFTYAIDDGNGGTDFATVNIAIDAVADVPTLSYEIIAGAAVNELTIRVTATQTDDDDSEFIDLLNWAVAGGLPPGVIITPDNVDPNLNSKPGQIVQDFKVTLPVDVSSKFDLVFTATATEPSNSDTQTASTTVAIDYAYKATDLDTTFQAQNQNMWGTGGAFTFVDDRFIGIDVSLAGGFNDWLFAETSGNLRAGFQSTLNFNGGEVDASVPYDLLVDTNYNKTTDVMVIGASASVLAGGGFTTTGPSGSYNLDFIFDMFFKIQAGFDWGGTIGKDTFLDKTLVDSDERLNILSLDSDDLSFTVPLTAGLSVTFAWPNISTTSDATNTYNAAGSSNDFLALDLDVDEAITQLAKLPVNPFAPSVTADITVASGTATLDLIDVDLGVGLNFLQEFALAVESLSTSIQFENGLTQSFTIGTDLTLANASSYDANNDGRIDFTLMADPLATMSNDTDLGFNFNWNFDILKGSYEAYVAGIKVASGGFGPMVDLGGTIPIASVDIYDKRFALNFQSQDLGFFA